jgi:hypothetical protein
MTPARTPQFSPIENLFSKVKRDLMDYFFENKEKTSQKISDLMFSYNEIDI